MLREVSNKRKCAKHAILKVKQESLMMRMLVVVEHLNMRDNTAWHNTPHHTTTHHITPHHTTSQHNTTQHSILTDGNESEHFRS
jgi:hypothetical protein